MTPSQAMWGSSVIAYSKGANDSLEALVTYPEIRERIVAVISAAGSISGSPLAEDAKQAHLSLITNWPGAGAHIHRPCGQL